jgi:hypothetical protein
MSRTTYMILERYLPLSQSSGLKFAFQYLCTGGHVDRAGWQGTPGSCQSLLHHCLRKRLPAPGKNRMGPRLLTPCLNPQMAKVVAGQIGHIESNAVATFMSRLHH